LYDEYNAAKYQKQPFSGERSLFAFEREITVIVGKTFMLFLGIEMPFLAGFGAVEGHL
jgi:hypothetical protein